MRTPSVALLLAIVIASGCGGEPADPAPEPVDSQAEPSVGADTKGATEAGASSARLRPLTASERKQLRMIAESIENVVDEFDNTVRGCDQCVDAAFPLVVADLDWPPYYLQRISARQRGCDPLAAAATGIYGFNLEVRQLDSAAVAESGTRQRDQVALVDGLRYIPYDLRDAASSCR